MENDEVKKYISNINKIIRGGNPKYLSYVSKEYLKNKRNNPVIATVMEDMIRKESLEDGSVYAIFVDKDNGINLDVMSDISKISNIPDFVKTVNALSGQNVDFSTMTGDELIIEGMDIAEELAQEVESLENEIDITDESASSKIETVGEEKIQGAYNKLLKAGTFTTVIAALFGKIKNRVKTAVEKVRTNVKSKKEVEENKKAEEENNKPKELRNTLDYLPKIDIDEEAVINQMKAKKQTNKSRSIGANVADDDLDTSDDNDNNDNNDDTNNAQEDDEPDI